MECVKDIPGFDDEGMLAGDMGRVVEVDELFMTIDCEFPEEVVARFFHCFLIL